jgi:hypothetical protein
MLKPLLLSLTLLFAACTVPPAQASDCLPVQTIIDNITSHQTFDVPQLLTHEQSERFLNAVYDGGTLDAPPFQLLLSHDLERGHYIIEVILDGVGCGDFWASPASVVQRGLDVAVGRSI